MRKNFFSTNHKKIILKIISIIFDNYILKAFKLSFKIKIKIDNLYFISTNIN